MSFVAEAIFHEVDLVQASAWCYSEAKFSLILNMVFVGLYIAVLLYNR